MLSSLLAYAIFLLLKAKAVKSGVTVDQNSCSGPPDHLQDVGNAFMEMINMVNWAYTRTIMTRDASLAISPTDMMVVIDTFDAYFEIGNQDTATTVGALLGILDDVANLLNTQENIEIYCGDGFLSESDVDGNGVQYPPGITQLVIRTISPPKWLPLDFRRCESNAIVGGVIAYALPELGWIILCPETLAEPATVSPTNQNDFSTTDDTIEDMQAISSHLFHEFLHVLYNDFMFNASKEIYGFEGCHELQELAEPGTSAIHHPDCVMLYALSLYCTGNDWHTGSAEPYPRARGGGVRR